jgi:hypothetical protein
MTGGWATRSRHGRVTSHGPPVSMTRRVAGRRRRHTALREDRREELLQHIPMHHADGKVAHVQLTLLAAGRLHPPSGGEHARVRLCPHLLHGHLLRLLLHHIGIILPAGVIPHAAFLAARWTISLPRVTAVTAAVAVSAREAAAIVIVAQQSATPNAILRITASVSVPSVAIVVAVAVAAVPFTVPTAAVIVPIAVVAVPVAVVVAPPIHALCRSKTRVCGRARQQTSCHSLFLGTSTTK